MNQIQPESCISKSHPLIAAEWHPTKNTGTPDQVPSWSKEAIWWVCQGFPHHEWQSTVATRVHRVGCPFCAGEKVNIPGDRLKMWDPVWDHQTSLKNQLSSFLRELIEEGVFDAVPKRKLPSEQIAADVFGMSRMTARAALDLLKDQNLVKRTPRGTFALDQAEESYLEDLALGTSWEKRAALRRGEVTDDMAIDFAFGEADPEEETDEERESVGWADTEEEPNGSIGHKDVVPDRITTRHARIPIMRAKKYPYPIILCVGEFGAQVFFNLLELLKDDFQRFDRRESTLDISELSPNPSDGIFDPVKIKVLRISDQQPSPLDLQSLRRSFVHEVSRKSVMEITIDKLEDNLGVDDTVVLIAEIDGAQQKTLLTDLCTRLQDLGVATVALLGLEKVHPSLQTPINKLVSQTSQCTLVDLDLVVSAQDTGPMGPGAFSNGVGQIFSNGILTLLSSALVTNELVEDAKSRRKDFDDLVSSKTLWTIGFGEASGENRIILACNKAREQLRKQGFYYGDVHNVLIQFTGSLKIGELQQALNEMTSGLDQTVNIVFDVGPTDFEIGGADGEENFKVVIFADKPTSTSQE